MKKQTPSEYEIEQAYLYALSPEFHDRVIDWYAGEDHDVSSATMMSVMLNSDTPNPLKRMGFC